MENKNNTNKKLNLPKTWEDMISLNNRINFDFEVLECAKVYYEEKPDKPHWKKKLSGLLEKALEYDKDPLPLPKDRENYHPNDHFGYWASGLRDYKNIIDCCEKHNLTLTKYFDLGCASGRVIRHFSNNQSDIQVYGCDINKAHVEWCNKFLSPKITVFQNHSIPTLPLNENSIDLISAFSIFSHIENFETSWLMELRRILKPGGLAWITIHSESTWEEIQEDWPLYRLLKNHPDFDTIPQQSPMKSDRKIFRWSADSSYSSIVFYRMDYIKRVWGKFFEILEVHRKLTGFQDVLVLKKTAY